MKQVDSDLSIAVYFPGGALEDEPAGVAAGGADRADLGVLKYPLA